MSWWTIVLYFTVTGAVEALFCDDLTQYLRQDGQCCKKCGPGTRMYADITNCLDPICKPCKEYEYQAGYTMHDKCDLQPYCDPNKNFVHDGPVSTEKRVECVCRDRYHCSSQACITCVENTPCGPGKGVRVKVVKPDPKARRQERPHLTPSVVMQQMRKKTSRRASKNSVEMAVKFTSLQRPTPGPTSQKMDSSFVSRKKKRNRRPS
ncbi:hypothetical protein CRUP_025243 [Coryphaenoides rupestris]|nr:hypothetical protein CRUP_025243 [Coryphaenoides rupestris]